MSTKKNQHLPSLDIFHSFGTFASWSWFCWWFNPRGRNPMSIPGALGLPGAGWNWPRRGWYLTCHPAADSTFRNWCGPGWKQNQGGESLPFPRKILQKLNSSLACTSKTDIPYICLNMCSLFPKFEDPQRKLMNSWPSHGKKMPTTDGTRSISIPSGKCTGMAWLVERPPVTEWAVGVTDVLSVGQWICFLLESSWPWSYEPMDKHTNWVGYYIY